MASSATHACNPPARGPHNQKFWARDDRRSRPADILKLKNNCQQEVSDVTGLLTMISYHDVPTVGEGQMHENHVKVYM